MKDGECIKCGKKGHIGKECRTGWKYDAAAAATPAVTTVEKDKKKKRTKEESKEEDAPTPKRRLIDQPDGSIKTIASRFEELSDSGKD